MKLEQPQQLGVLLLNMGGPACLDQVEPYIFSLLADPDMVRMPLGWLLQEPFARMVARRRAPKVRERYKLIGGSSPIGAATARQASLLADELDIPVRYAMRYTPPTVSQALDLLKVRGVTHLIVLPLYPQYSSVSTLSSLKDFELQAEGGAKTVIIDRHFDHPGYLCAMQSLLTTTLSSADPQLKTHIMFVAHSIPESYIADGDTYAEEIEATQELVIAGLPSAPTHSLAYQSRVGPVKWRGPTLEEELERLVAQQIEQLIVQPLSFVSENLETLYDLDIVFKQQAQEKGIQAYHRVPTLSDSPLYIEALADLVGQAARNWEQEDA